jgi:predicted ATPase
MGYKSFRIRGYKGINKDIVIDLERSSLIPIIGINECGKTTILEAFFSFDRFNDTSNSGRHLENIENMYSTLDSDIRVEAKVDFHFGEFIDIANEFVSKYENNLKESISDSVRLETVKKLEKIKEYIIYFELRRNDFIIFYIGRDLKLKRYYFLGEEALDDSDLNNELCYELMRILPYTLYFDDFRDRLDEKIEIAGGKDDAAWIMIINRLFKLTKEDYSVFDLPNKNENIRRSIISEVEIKLNEELLKEWPHFSIQQKQPLEIKIGYSTAGDKHYLEFLVVEKIQVDGKEKERFFRIQDRSKGFFWYFNFIMKLIFNTKSRNLYDSDTIYLLDEPGSYLHSTAQYRLTKRLKDISKKNKIIYCTHSPYLLDPQLIPISSIKIVEKSVDGSIELKSAFESKIKINKKNSAYQPIYDALDVKPVLLDYDISNIVLVEGIYDFLSFEMFKDKSTLNFFPCVNADSILNNISYMIFLRKNYLALWDNDKEGIEQMKRAQKYFGDIESKRFILLPIEKGRRKARLENIYDAKELTDYKTHFGLPKNQSFEKTILHLFYSEKRDALLPKFFDNTKRNFLGVISSLETQMTKK